MTEYFFESSNNRVILRQREVDPVESKTGLIASFNVQEAASLLKTLTLSLNKAAKMQEQYDVARYKELKDKRQSLADQLQRLDEQLAQMEIKGDPAYDM